MRSIGKRNIALVKRITRKVIAKCKKEHSIIGSPNYSGIEDRVTEHRLLAELYDSIENYWEVADREIRRIIQSEIAKAI